MKNNIDQDIYIGIFIAGFSVVIVYLASKISGDSKILPLALAVILAGFGIMITLSGIRKKQLGKPSEKTLTLAKLKVPAQVYLIIITYFILFYFLGYYTSTAFFLTMMMLYLRSTFSHAVIISMSTVLILYGIFNLLFHVPTHYVGIIL